MIRRFALAILAWPLAVAMMLWDVVVGFCIWFVAYLHELREEAMEARALKKPKKFDPEHIPVVLPAHMGPLVETLESEHPLPLTQVPVRSSKADSKREALAYARQRTGNPELQWKAARKLLNQWEREEREKNRELAEATS